MRAMPRLAALWIGAAAALLYAAPPPPVSLELRD